MRIQCNSQRWAVVTLLPLCLVCLLCAVNAQCGVRGVGRDWGCIWGSWALGVHSVATLRLPPQAWLGSWLRATCQFVPGISAGAAASEIHSVKKCPQSVRRPDSAKALGRHLGAEDSAVRATSWRGAEI